LEDGLDVVPELPFECLGTLGEIKKTGFVWLLIQSNNCAPIDAMAGYPAWRDAPAPMTNVVL
jgi:hypothetical protein